MLFRSEYAVKPDEVLSTDIHERHLNDRCLLYTSVTEPYKKANRKFHPDDSVIDVDGVKIGGGSFAVIAGPCSIESEEQITYCAQRVKAAGASLLRGGAFKPRTSPYSCLLYTSRCV